MKDPATARFTLKVARMPSGLWCIESPELKGMMVAERTFSAAMATVPIAIGEIRRALETTPGTAQAKSYERIFCK